MTSFSYWGKMLRIMKIIFMYVFPIFLGLYTTRVIFLWDAKQIYSHKSIKVYTDNNAYTDTLAWRQIINECDSLLNLKGTKMRSTTIRVFSSYEDIKKITGGYMTAAYFPLADIIFVGPLDLKKRKNVPFQTLKARSIPSILIHEMTHINQYYTMPFKSLKNDWRLEGQAEYFAGSSSFDTTYGIKLFVENTGELKDLLTKDRANAAGYYYFLYRLRTDYLIRHKEESYDNFFDTEYNLDSLDKEIRTALVNNEYTFSN